MVDNKKGYTLIELIVVMGIAAIIFGITIASFDSFKSSQRMDGEIENLKSKIEEIYKKTSSGDLEGNVGCIGLPNRCDSSSYTFSVLPNGSGYSLSFFCDCTDGEMDPNPKVLYKTNIPASAKIKFSSVPSSFVFEKNKNIVGCIDILYKDTNYKAISFSYPGNINIGDAGTSCP